MDYQIELDTIIDDDTIILKGFEDWIGKKVHISVVLDKSNENSSDVIVTDGIMSNENGMKNLRGIFSKFANPDLRNLEKTAWEDSVSVKYKNNENS